MKRETLPPPDAAAVSLGTLLELARRARHAASQAELGFIAVNETFALVPYRQAALWLEGKGVRALSGVASPEANAPYVQWLIRIARQIAQRKPERPVDIDPAWLCADEVAEWDEWLPAHVLWLPLRSAEGASLGALILARESAWSEAERVLLGEWMDHWLHAWRAHRSRSVVARMNAWFTRKPAVVEKDQAPAPLWRRAWRNPAMRYMLIALIALCIPVRLSVLAPGELVPANPAVLRAPFEGTVERFFVRPNAPVQAGDKLFQLDLNALTSKLQIAEQALATAQAEYRQSAQQAVFDTRSKAQLALNEGRIAERRAEVEYLRGQLDRAQVVAPRAGIVLMDDPSEWEGKPVAAGERIMSVADDQDVEIEAWLAPGDSIRLAADAAVNLYLNATPFAPVAARLRYLAYEAQVRPDGTYAYRVRAKLEPGQALPRVGLKGTAKLTGDYVPLGYWVLRRPLAVARQTLGL